MRQLYFSRLLLRALPALLLVSCAPRYYLSLKPARPTNLFVEGREQAQAFGADSVEVRLIFVGLEPTRLVFEAVYRNPTRRGQRLVVAPTAFFCLPSRPETAAALPRARRPAPSTSVSATIAAASVAAPLPVLPAQPVAAFDPEPEITQLQATAAREAAKARRFDRLSAAGFGGVVVDVPKIRHAIAADASHRRALILQEYALRQVTLEPGQQVRGLLYFPRFDAADAVRVLAPAPGGALPLDFVQTHTRR